MIEALTVLDALEGLLDRAGERRRLVSVTVPADIDDPCALAFASRLAGERWFCWEEPERGFALAGLGSAHEAVSRGPQRFEELARECAEVARGRLADEPAELPAGAGPVWAGGFAFDPEGGRASQWSSFPPALLHLPEISIARSSGSTWLTVAAIAGGAEGAARGRERIARRLSALRDERLPMLDPSPAAGRSQISSAGPPERHEQAVAAAARRIRAGELEKVVLAREVRVEAPSAHDPAALFGALRELFASCFCFCCGTPEGAFLGASPELLVRRSGAGASSVALAGSARRSADPAIDAHLGEQLLRSPKERAEQAIVARRIERQLAPRSVWVEAAAEPSLVKVANVQHLATPIRAQLAEPASAIELAGLLHPTPAVAGEPRDGALEVLAELEALDRGWYAGPVGWMDAAEDGELCVALRSALLRDRTAHLYAGGGIVADSEPAAELAETEVKLEALLPLLAT